MKILLLSILLLKGSQTNFIEKSIDLMDQGLIIVNHGHARIDNWRYYSSDLKNPMINYTAENQSGIKFYFNDYKGF